MAARTTTAAAKGAKKPPSTASSPPKITPPPAKPATAKATDQAPAKQAGPVTVTLKHLAAALGERHAMAKQQADAVVTDVFEMLVTHLKAGERVRIGGLGILEVKNRPARMGRNPATGEAIPIKASKKIAFRAAKDLKNAV